MALPTALSGLPSARVMNVPAVISRLPAAVNAVGVVPLKPSSILRLTLPAAASLMAPELMVVRLVYEFTPISRPAMMLMPAALSASPLLVACMLPSRRTSNAPMVVSLTNPFVVNAPTLSCPSVRVKSMLPDGLNVPPVWLKSVLTVIDPEPPRLPALKLTTGAVKLPFTVKAVPPRLSSVPAPMAKLPEVVMLPPLNTRFSSDEISARLKLPPVSVMVWLPGTLRSTFCPVVGALPVLQLVPIDQSPLVPIQQSSTRQPVVTVRVVEVAP